MDDKLLAKGEPAGQHKNKKDQERKREVLKSEEQKDSPKVERQEDGCAQNPEFSSVEVYLRFGDSKSLKTSMALASSVEAIKARVQELAGIAVEQQVLFYRGKELEGERLVRLQQKAIVHVKGKQQPLELITLHVIKHLPQERNLFKLSFDYTSLQVRPQQAVGEALHEVKVDCQHIDYARTKVVECGRFLKLDRTFAQEKIQGLTQLHLIFRKRLQENEPENQQEEKLLIESLLKRSAIHSRTARESNTERLLRKLDHQQKQENQQSNPKKGRNYQEGREEENREADRDTKHHECREVRMAEDLDGRRQQEDFGIRRSLPNYYSATKASEFWQSAKFIRKELTPLKFSFREYKRYDGPKSVRDCNCKRRSEFYESCEHLSESGDKELPHESKSPKQSKLRSLKVLKTRASMFF